MFQKIATAVLGLMAFAAVGNASIYTVTAPTGASATANFTFGTNTLNLVLTDTVVNPTDVALNLSAFGFTILGSTGITEISASSPDFRTVNDGKSTGGTFSDASGPTTVLGVGWVLSASSAAYELDVLSGTGHAGPANTLIGSPDGSNKYSNANGSIAGNGPHNPFLAPTITLNFTFASGVSSSTIPTSVFFQFGTTDGSGQFTGCLSGGPTCTSTTTPEPITSGLVGTGLIGLFFLGRRARRKA
jgi:hypothetical protein